MKGSANYWDLLSGHDYLKKDMMSLTEEAYLTQKGLLLESPDPEDVARSGRPDRQRGCSAGSVAAAYHPAADPAAVILGVI